MIIDKKKYYFLYAQEVEIYIPQIEESLAQKEIPQEKLLRYLHSIKGMAKALQFKDHVEQLFEMETKVENAEYDVFKLQFLNFKKTVLEWIALYGTKEEEKVSLTNVLKQIEGITQTKGIATMVTDDIPLPSYASSKIFLWISTLTMNAVAHAFTNQNSPSICLSGSVEEENFSVRFEDNGSGIDLPKIMSAVPQQFRQKLEKIYEKKTYTEADRQLILEALCLHGLSTSQSTTDIAGRGVGLTSLRKEIERLDGSLTLTATGPLGTVFTLKMPLSEPDADKGLA